MSSFKRAPVTGGQPRQDVLASLRATQLVGSKPVLPAELIEMILDYLPVPDMLRFARVSRRMREMVYDDTRWTQRLKSMGCWSDQEARQRFEEGMKRRTETQRAREAEERRRTGAGLNGSVNGIAGGGRARGPSITLFDAGWEEEKHQNSTAPRESRRGTLEAGFDAMTLSPDGASSSPTGPAMGDPTEALTILRTVRSIRGRARHEYGRLYGALGPYYNNLVQARSHTDPLVFRTYRDPEQQARMLSQLKIFAKSDFALGWRAREDRLDSMIGIFENAVLREFEQGYAEQDIDGRMRRYATVLVTLNGGVGVVDMFIQNHPLLVQKEGFGNPLDCLRNELPGGITLEPSSDFFRRLAAAVNEQASIIERVFPASAKVFLPFIERVTEEVISEYVTTLLDEAHSRSVEIYLTAASGLFQQSLQLCRVIQPPKGSSNDSQEQVVKIIAQAFEPHVDLYLQDELDFFKSKSEAEVTAWEKRLSDEAASTEALYMSSVNRQVVKRDFLTSFKKVVMMPVNALPAIPIGSAFSASKRSSVQRTTANDALEVTPSSRPISPMPPPSPQPEAPTTELAAKAAIMNSRLEGIKTLFSIEVALNLVHTAKASLERAAPFVQLGGQSGEEAKEQCEAIFVVLLQILGNRHIKTGFDKAVSHLSVYNPREVLEHNQPGVEPLVTFLELVNVGDLIQQMVDVFYVQELTGPKLVDNNDFLSPAVKEKKRFEQMLDERVAAGLNKGIDVLMDEVEFICATTQLPTDYNPTNLDFDVGPSETAKKVVEIVSSHTAMLIGSTDKNMLDVFNQEVGVRLFTALCKHLKRQRISIDGAMKLISDINHYHSYIVTLRNKALTPYFSALKELSQIYLIDASNAKEIATIVADTDRYYGIFRAEEVLEFAERRADWYQIRTNVERAMYGIGCLVM